MDKTLEKYFGSDQQETELPTTGIFAMDRNKDIFIMNAGGNGMVNEGIKDKDVLIVERCSDVKSGEIAVVWYKDQAYVKIYRKLDNGSIELAYADGHSKSIIVPKDCKDFSVLGKLYAVFRRLY